MTTYFRNITFSLLALVVCFSSCKKEEYAFGDLRTPANVGLNAVIAGTAAATPNGNGSGNVAITTTATNAITYKIDFGDGKSQIVPSGTINYKYSNPGTFDYVITVSAIGTGGSVSTLSKKITVFVAFEIPLDIVQFLTNGSSRKWMTDNTTIGHVGVGPADQFAPIWYEATPNTREPCQYDDEITFSKDANNNITMTIDNKGQTFVIGAATASYGLAGGDNCYAISSAGAKRLIFMDATSASTTANSTRIQFTVPGDGIVNFASGGNAYEILSVTANTLHLRNIGADGNAWYQKLKVKP